MLEGKNLAVLNAIWSNEDGLASGGSLVADICRRGHLFNGLAFSFLKRDGNYVTYFSAKFSRSISECIVRLEDPPIWVKDFLLFDVFVQN